MNWPACYDHVFTRLQTLTGSGGETGWEAKCPAHDDNKPSLTLLVTKDGKLLVNCHAPSNCSARAIMKGLGLTLSDLFPDNKTAQPSPRPAMSETAPAAAPAEKKKSKFVRSYDYRDENGKLLMQVCRFAEPKGFSQRQPNPAYDPKVPKDAKTNPEWLTNAQGVRRVPYKLPELIKALTANKGRWVLVLEGEKDVEEAWAVGLLATCNPGGALKWDDAFSGFLKGMNCLVIPDNDPIDTKLGFSPGFKHAQQVADSLIDVAQAVKVLTLPGLGPKGDFYDWVQARKAEKMDNKAIHMALGQLMKAQLEFKKGDKVGEFGPPKEAEAAAPAATPDPVSTPEPAPIAAPAPAVETPKEAEPAPAPSMAPIPERSKSALAKRKAALDFGAASKAFIDQSLPQSMTIAEYVGTVILLCRRIENAVGPNYEIKPEEMAEYGAALGLFALHGAKVLAQK